MVLGRLILISCYIGLVALDRFCKKRSADTSSYPKMTIRHKSVVFHALRRILDNSARDDYDVPKLEFDELGKVLSDMCQDLISVHQIVFDPRYGDFQDKETCAPFFENGALEISGLFFDQITCQLPFLAPSPTAAVQQALECVKQYDNRTRIFEWFHLMQQQYRHASTVFWPFREGKGLASPERLEQELQHLYVLDGLFGSVADRLR